MPSRQCGDWLQALLKYVEETESPRDFWIWSGISTIAGALQRKVWIPFGLDQLYPNLYVMVVAPPGECRKGAPVSLSKKLLQAIKCNVFADSPTKRALTMSLDRLCKGQGGMFYITRSDGTKRPKTQAAMSLISKEFSSFLAVDPKAMIEILTDLFDAHDEWEYKTKGEGTDKIFGLCINCLFASTPSWIATNLPEEAIGGGFTSRFAIVTATEKYKWISLPPPPDETLYRKLVADLHQIKQLSGEFQWGEGAYELYDSWYKTIPKITTAQKDVRLKGYIARMHIMVLKVAMCLHVSCSDSLILHPDDIGRGIEFMEQVLKMAPQALGGQGRTRMSAETDQIMQQIRGLGSHGNKVSFHELLQFNFRNTSKPELREILDTLCAMRTVKESIAKDGESYFEWISVDPTGIGGKPRKSRAGH